MKAKPSYHHHHRRTTTEEKRKRKMLEVKRIGVVGSGQMGSGIAQVAAMHGIDVWLHDLDPQALSKASSSISSSINRFVSKNHISQVAGADALKRLRLTTDLEDLQLADLIIEAIVESEDVKKSLFAQLDRIAKSSAILASNTSSISVTRLATSTSRPRQVIGMHFMNPPPVMKLIEIVRGADTSEETFVATKALSERLGKVVITSHDYSGFIVNRILMPMINEAFFALYLCSMLMLEDLEENEVLVCMNIVKIQGLQNHLPVSKMFVSLGRTSFQHPHFNYLVSDRGGGAHG
uniref:3-hydroxyacyl-CoA dehydrogenase NAD binding domain-containing protein n=1 Tax=Glycine max TaxID=3847 RepID=C6TEJ1_SOYBN|nr:unknown [Glycine max]